MPTQDGRAGILAAVIAVILILGAAQVLAVPGREDPADERGSSLVVAVVKTPLLWFSRVAVTQYRVEQHVSSSILHMGVDVFTGIIRWFSRDEGAEPPAVLPKQL